MILSLLMLLAAQTAPAPAAQTAPVADGPAKHGIWTGQCWPTGLKAGPLCRATASKPGKLFILIERSPAKMDVYAAGACAEDLPPLTLTQAQLTGADRVKLVSKAIIDAVAKANASCKSSEAFAVTDADVATLLADTDMIAGGAGQ